MEFCNWRMLLVVLLSFCFWKQAASAECPPAIFAFGASQSDTGNSQATYSYNPKKHTNPPYGDTFFKKPTTRHSDGRVIVDFFAQALGIPLLSPSRSTVDADFSHGVNFAFAGVMTQNNTHPEHVTPPFYYWKQVQEFEHFKKQAIEAWNNLKTKDGKLKASWMVSTHPDYFDTGLYFTTFGTNDFVAPLMNLGKPIEEVNEKISDISKAMVDNTEELIKLGAKTIMVFNVPPLGCYPAFLILDKKIVGNIGSDKCLTHVNDMIWRTNLEIQTGLEKLREKLKEEKLREKYKEVTIIYADFYSALFSLIKDGESDGLTERFKPCCGPGHADNGVNGFSSCGQPSDKMPGEGKWCGNPGSYIHWDGVHITDAAAGLVAKKLLKGEHTDPPFNLDEHCKLDYTQFKKMAAYW